MSLPFIHTPYLKEYLLTLDSISTIMTFELLPNEILIKCFEYLNAPDIFYSFERLNYRFDELIRHIYLHLNFQHIKKSTFDQFCRKLLLNPQIKKQISSLKLSNESDTCCQIQTFLSLFSFDEFSALRSLTLIDAKKTEVIKILAMLSSLSNLRYFSLNYARDMKCQLLNPLPILNYRTLLIPDLTFIQEATLTTNLTLTSCTSWSSLNRLFICVPGLKYLNIQALSCDDSCLNGGVQAISLKKLVMKTQWIIFDRLEILLKQTPNLENLTLHSSAGKELVNADRWEQLISFSLSHLNYFKFQFEFTFENQNEQNWTSVEVFDKFQQFQTYFWHKQHHWFTASEFEKDMAIIYTIPYLSDTYRLTMYTNRYSNNSFNNITNLELFTGALRKDFQHYFSNIKSLKLQNAYYSYDIFHDPSNEREDIESLKRIVNLSNLKHLDIETTCRMESSLILFKILKEAPHLSSIRIDASALVSLINDDDLYQYLNRMIKKFDVVKHNDHLNISSYVIKKFCQIFSNIEQLQFPIQRSDDLFLFLSQLSNLSNITVHCLFFPFNINLWLQEIAMKLNKSFLFESIQDDYDVLRPIWHIWIGDNIN